MAYRYAFGDESGDPGFTFDRGSSHYLVVLLLLLDDPEPLRDRVDRLRQQLELPPGVEFKFHKTSAANRRVFLAALQSHQFVGYALVVDKGQLSAGWRSASDVGFHALCFAELIGRIPANELGDTILVLDRFGASKTTLRELRSRLKVQGEGQTIRPFKRILLKRSRGDNLIQCADMVAGALMRAVSASDRSFFDLVHDKITVWQYQPDENPPN